MTGFVAEIDTDQLERALSKTQLETWRACKRMYGWKYFERLEKTGKHRELGKKVHRQLEIWLRDGRLPDADTEAGRIAESSLHLLPHPTTKPLVEIELFTINKTAVYHGFADWIEPPPSDLCVPVIGDHKSTGDFKWAMKPADLKKDIQANIYARAAMDYFRSDAVKARWNYLRTRGTPKTHPVEEVLIRREVEQFFAETIDPLAEQIHEARRIRLPVLELEPNYKACEDYGGCDYRENCGVSAKERFLAMIAKPSNLAEKMKAQAAAKAAAAGGAPAAETKPADAQINPPKEEKPAASTPASAGGLKAKMAGLAAAAKQKTAETPPVPAPETAPATAASTPPAADPKQPDLPHVTPTDAPSAPTLPAPATIGGVILLVGCFPTQGTEVVHATDYIDKAKRLIEEDTGLRDYRLADFNKGPGMLSAAVRQLLSDAPPAEGSFIFLDNRTDEGRHSFDAFREIADVVVRSL